MAYNNFTLTQTIRQFGLELRIIAGLYRDVPQASISERLRIMLEVSVDVGVNIGTEKARSEFIVAPILLEVKQQAGEIAGFFSGVDFNVDAAAGLTGFCDFLWTLEQAPFIVSAPVLAIVEAKKEDMEGGTGQCLAELVAAYRFNEQEGKPLKTVYGVVTTGSNWRFMELSGTRVRIESGERSVADAPQIVGILLHMIRSAHAERSAGS